MSNHIDVSTLREQLGAGRHGTVLRSVRDGRDVAVKIPPSPDVGAREAAALQRLRHPHVIDLVEHPIEGAPLVLEYCAAGTVADRLRSREPMSPADVASFLEPVLDALDHVHAAGWIHGDISPANLGIRENGAPVLLDFGASRPGDGSWITEGTPEFVGPLRRATPTLDVRGMAAVARALLGSNQRPESVEQHARLDELIRAADDGAELTIADIRRTFDRGRPTPERSGPDRSGGTIDFGPSPRPTTTVPTDRTAGPSRRALLLLPLALLVAFAFATDLFGPRPVEATSAPTVPVAEAGPLRVTALRAPGETLSGAGVRWSIDDGMLHGTSDAGALRWLVGMPGDLAAVGRWTCTADATLGVYRPSTGEWFVFDSWDDDAESSTPTRMEPNRTLAVDVGEHCDVPVLLD